MTRHCMQYIYRYIYICHCDLLVTCMTGRVKYMVCFASMCWHSDTLPVFTVSGEQSFWCSFYGITLPPYVHNATIPHLHISTLNMVTLHWFPIHYMPIIPAWIFCAHIICISLSYADDNVSPQIHNAIHGSDVRPVLSDHPLFRSWNGSTRLENTQGVKGSHWRHVAISLQ